MTPIEPVSNGHNNNDDERLGVSGALSVLRRGLAASPELRRGLVITALMGVAVAVGKLTIPVIIERVVGSSQLDDGSLDVGYVARMAALAATVIVASAVVMWLAQRRLVVRAEETIASLRIAAFRHVHRLSIADHNETRRGVLVARVTSDAEAMARFANWGLFSWTVQPVMIVGILAVAAWYAWPLALVIALAYVPVLPWYRWLQRRQLAAYDELRTRVGDMLTYFSEAVMGAAVVRAYGVEQQTNRQLRASVRGRYRSAMRANKYMAGLFVGADVMTAVGIVLVLVIGVALRRPLGLDGGELVALLFLASLMGQPVAELGETLDHTQTAIAGWRKILDLLDTEPDVPEPVAGATLPRGALPIEAIGVDFAYRDGGLVLRDVTVSVPAGATVAVVGETGSGKTTFAKLLCRLADPTSGRIELAGLPLAEVSPESRLQSVRMVPQDGFLFDATIRENVRFGSPGASDAEVEAAFTSLGLGGWLAGSGHGLDDRVGERGESLSVGERQLVALARAGLADPGLLILDEATSAVDPETDQALSAALRVLAEGRTIVSIAHRLATAEAADLILVFDQGRLVEQGPHAELVTHGGHYARLHEAWVGNTRRLAG